MAKGVPKGRRPKPSKLLAFHGNPGKRPLPADEPQPKITRRVPYAPQTLDDLGKREWRRMARALYDLGLLTQIDLTMLHAYCQSFSEWQTAVLAARVEGTVVTTPSGYVQQSPHVGMANRALQNMQRIAVEFGLTPASRSRVTTPPLAGTGTDGKASGGHADEVEQALFGPRGSDPPEGLPS